MIYTLTVNPSIDYIVEVSDLKEGMVNRTDREVLFPGGKGINVSIVLKNMGMETEAMGFVGGFSGDFIESALIEKGIRTNFVHIVNENSRINIKIKSKQETEINGLGPKISQEKKEELFRILDNLTEDDVLVLAGSVSKSLGEGFYGEIMDRLSKKKIKIVVDAEKKLLFETLKKRPFLIKPNNFELEEICGEAFEENEDIKRGAKKLLQLGAENVIVSLGKNGGLFVSKEFEEAYYCPSPKGVLKNSTGAGDSVVAGFLAEYTKSKNLKKAFLMGISCGSATAFREDFAEKEDAKRLFEEIKDKICVI